MDDGEKAADFAEFEARANAGEPEEVNQGGDEAEEQPSSEAEEEPQGNDGEEEAEQAPDEPEKPKKGKPAHERISELTREREEARREAAEVKRQLEELQKPKPEAPKAEEGPKAPNPDDYDLGDMDPKYQSDLIDWRFEQKTQAWEKEQQEKAEARKAEEAAAAMTGAYKERVTEAAEKYPDYEEVVTASAVRGEWPCSETMTLAIMTSEVGPDVAHYLATNKAEAKRISDLHPLGQAQELGRIEARFLNATPPKKTTSAPPPPNTLTRGAGGKFTASPDTTDFASFEKMASRGR